MTTLHNVVSCTQLELFFLSFHMCVYADHVYVFVDQVYVIFMDATGCLNFLHYEYSIIKSNLI